MTVSNTSTRIITVIIILLFQCAFGYGQTECCDLQDCSAFASTYAEKWRVATDSFPNLGDADDQTWHDVLNSKKITRPEIYIKFENTYNEVIEWCGEQDTTFRFTCFLSKLANNPDKRNWFSIMRKSLIGQEAMLSPEFKQGWSIQSELGSGGLNIGKSDERYSLTLKSMIAYTFHGKFKGERTNTAGRFRLLAGPELRYSGTHFYFGGVIRGEYRLMDIKTEFFSIGNVKLYGETEYIGSDFGIGGGLGLELEKFGFWLGGTVLTDDGDYILQSGLMYRFEIGK